MRKFFLCSFCSLTVWITLAQQKIQPFEIIKPKNKIENGLYGRIKVLDSRIDTLNMGFVQSGLSNEISRVYFERGLENQLNDLLLKVNGGNTKTGELLLNLRRIHFSEITERLAETGYCSLRAELYAKKENGYVYLASLDTLMVNNALDVTSSMLKNGGSAISNLIIANLVKCGTDSIVSYHDIAKTDSIEKSKIKAYNTLNYADGLYSNYAEFAKQELRREVDVDDSDSERIKVVEKKVDGKIVTVDCKKVFCAIKKGQLYIATDYGFEKMFKKENDLYFTGRAKITLIKSPSIPILIGFGGVVGGFIQGYNIGASMTNVDNAIFIMRLDHKSGRFIRLRQLNTKNVKVADIKNDRIVLENEVTRHKDFMPDEVFFAAEKFPEFPEGIESMNKYVSSNIEYPLQALKNDIQGKVIVQFVVDKNGEILNTKVVKSLGYGCDEEALRVVNCMPRWKPGKSDGKPVAVWYTIPVVFAISK